MINCLIASISVLVTFLSYWVPSLTEIILISVNGRGTDVATGTILVYAILQSLLALIAGVRLMYQLQSDQVEYTFHKCCAENDLCCPSPVYIKNLWSGSYLTSILPVWVITNILCSWFNAMSMTWWEHLFSYLPIPLYVLGLGLGYAWSKTWSHKDYEPVANV